MSRDSGYPDLSALAKLFAELSLGGGTCEEWVAASAVMLSQTFAAATAVVLTHVALPYHRRVIAHSASAPGDEAVPGELSRFHLRIAGGGADLGVASNALMMVSSSRRRVGDDWGEVVLACWIGGGEEMQSEDVRVWHALAPAVGLIYERRFAVPYARRRAMLDRLRPAQQAVLPLLAEGKPTRFIAAELGRSVHTVNDHIRVILETFDARTRDDVRAMWDGDRSGGD